MPILAALWIGLTLLQRFTRYAEIDRKIKNRERQTSSCVLELRKTSDSASLVGGGIPA